MKDRPLTREEEQRSVERLSFFSDAVFAIAITLLVLDLEIPGGYSQERLENALRHSLPDVLAFLLTFFLVALYWSKHHRAFAVMVRADTGLVWLNFVFLASIAFMPFPSSLLSEYPRRPLVLLIYAGANLVAATMSAVLWLYAWRRHRLIRADFPLHLAAEGTARGLVLPAGFLISVPLALLAPPSVLWALWVLLIPAAGLAGMAYRTRGARV